MRAFNDETKHNMSHTSPPQPRSTPQTHPLPPAHSTSPLAFIVLSVMTGLIGGFIYPLLSFFLVDEINIKPAYIGVYMVLVTVSGLTVSQFFGRLADNGRNPKHMYIVANIGIILALCVYANTHSFIAVLLAGIGLMSLGNASMPQMLTLGRQWANTQPNIDITAFNAQVRAGISFSWMIGPPIAFSVVAILGFAGVFSLAIAIACSGILFVVFIIPTPPPKPHTNNQKTQHTKAPLSFWFLALAVVMGSMGNNMYTSSLALYTIKELQLASYMPGVLMGLVAGLEIPIMLWSSRLSKKISMPTIMLCAFGFGFVFYIGIFFASELWHFIALQILNAVFYGLFAGVGLTLMQAQLPNRVGFTSAVYSNAFKIGVMFGASITGLIAQLLSFQYANLGAACSAILGACCLLLFLYMHKSEKNTSHDK